MQATQAAHITFNDSELPAGDLKYRNPYQASLDGNTVEMPVEQAAFSENNVRYQASLNFINLQDIRAAVRHRRPVASRRVIMSLFNVFNVSGSALNAETIRLNTTASNLANAESVNGDVTKVYRARHPVFQAMMNAADASFDDQDAADRAYEYSGSSRAPRRR